ncbi:MAG: PEP-CTERM sorting domain-containing protein [Planctomycetota bacterium]
MWRECFGAAVGAPATVVPEPTGVALVLVAAAAMTRRL